ncbi:SMC5-SMC6 complex localization factor protein 2-like isoform X2 [Babylonia areolata]|uniref:SMC5-SMC6 complex localization factor protein 2-like isoform X2 n=1 Tax=Babylonia areolata TaxID=304850 RepID=UPI003FD438BC
MKTKKYEPQTDKKRQCEGNKYMSPKKALRTFKLARVSSTTAMEDKTDLDPSHSDHDENRSPKSPISDDSDDSLGDEPAFLSSVLGGSTPLSTVNTNMFAQDGQGLLGETTAGTRCRPTTFSLDSLLRDTKKHEAEEQKTIAMQEKLRKELLSGKSYSQEENESDEMDYENFTDEQKRTLKELRLEEEEIRDIAPGESVLSDPALGRLFTETVSPAACGVHIGASHACLRRLFDDYQPASLMDILSSDIISLTYHSLPCKPQIQRWLFFIMSVHSSVMEVRKCVDQLHQVLQWQMGDVHQTPTWTPPLLDLFRVFVNWGADLKDLVFDSSTIDQHELEQVLPLEGSVPWPVAPAPCHRNFEAVLKMLVSWLQARPGYSSQELNQLLLMLCRLSLDHSLCKMYILTELQMCLASILECYQPSEWNSVVPWLCRQLSQLSSHHHNQVYITKLLSSVCPRSRYLQQRLAYLLLHSALTTQPLPDTHLHQFQLADLVVLIPEFKQVLHKDSYHVASLVHLLDLSVGPAAHHVSQKKQLFRLLEAVRLIVSEIRDSMQRLDCTKVKGMLLHLCLKWDLAVKASNVKQRKIFSCFSSATKVQVEQLKDQGNAANDDNTLNDSSTSFSDDDLSNEEDTTPASTKVLKQDSGSDSTVKRDERPDHSRAKKRRDRSGVAEPSDCRRSGDRSCVQGSDGGRVGIFDVLNPSGAGDVPSGGDNSDVIKTARCRVAGTGVSGDHHSPVAADRDRVSEMCDSAGSGGGDAVRSVLPDTRTPGTSQPRLADSDTSALSNTDRLKVPDTNRSTESGRDRCRVTGMQRSRLSSDSDPEGTSDPDSADDSLPEL